MFSNSCFLFWSKLHTWALSLQTPFNPSLTPAIASELAFFTISCASTILDEGTTLAKGPLELGKTGLLGSVGKKQQPYSVFP